MGQAWLSYYSIERRSIMIRPDRPLTLEGLLRLAALKQAWEEIMRMFSELTLTEDDKDTILGKEQD